MKRKTVASVAGWMTVSATLFALLAEPSSASGMTTPVMRPDRYTPEITFSHGAASSLINYRSENGGPEKTLNIWRLLVTISGVNGPLPPRLIFGPFRYEGPYRFTSLPATTFSDGFTRIVLMKGRAWLLLGELPDFSDQTVFIIHDTYNNGYLCAPPFIERVKGAECVRLVPKGEYRSGI